MTIEEYRIGQKITLIRKSDATGESYSSTIQNIENNEIYIDLPYKGEIPLVLINNEQVVVKYIAKTAAFCFTAACVGVHKETETLQFYKLTAPAEQDIKKIQLREFVRVPMFLDVQYRLPDSELLQKGTTVDMSGGGMRLATKFGLRENQVIDLYFKISKKNQELAMSLKAQVVRSELIDCQMEIYHTGVKFLNLTRKKEDALVSFVLAKQIEQLRRC